MGNEKEKAVTPVMEDYLEAIYEIGLDKKVVRVRDIAARLDVKMPSVTSMLKNLNSRNFVEYEKYEYVELSPSGLEIALEIHRRHEALRQFLTKILRIDPQTADQEACQMEHALSGETLTRLVDFMAFIDDCPRTGDGWLDHFEEYRMHGPHPDKCRDGLNALQCSRFIQDETDEEKQA